MKRSIKLVWKVVCTPFSWKLRRDHRCFRYFENQITGDRKAVWSGLGYQPIDTDYLLAASGRSWVSLGLLKREMVKQ